MAIINKDVLSIITSNQVRACDDNKNSYQYMDTIIAEIPISVYWMNKDFVYLGCSNSMAKLLNLSCRQDIIGKTYADLYDKKSAAYYKKADSSVMTKGISLSIEEPLYNSDGTKEVYLSKKVPLHDADGTIIGMLGISVNITDRKKMEAELKLSQQSAESALIAMKQARVDEQKQREATELLRHENAIHKTQLDAQKEFTKMANQVAHDIRSPLASLLMIVKACEEIPERERIALRAAGTRINDIANNLLNQYRLEKSDASFETEEKKQILLSATLLQLLTEKKFQYQDYHVEFDCQLDHSGQFAFISIEPSSFKSMMSNLINNAVDAFMGKPGVVKIKINATNEWSTVIISDNGKGISEALIEKIMNNMAITEGKVDGNGIGLTQVRETLARNEGTLSIHSKIGEGTEINLKFPRITAPSWIAEEISLGKQDIVVILDDDHSIHGAWDSRFEQILKQAPEIKLYHFEIGQKALDFLSNLSSNDKKRTILLTDFELLKQELNGLDIVEQSKLSRSILVTSHYDNPDIQKRSVALNTKIVPKQLASEIPIIFFDINDALPYHAEQCVHAILVDDDVEFVENVMCYSFDDSDVIIHFTSPEELKKNLAQYPDKYSKNTKICLDNNFDMSSIKGVQLAQELHDMGYTRLYLISGDTFLPGELPEYITVLAKGDISKIKDW